MSKTEETGDWLSKLFNGTDGARHLHSARIEMDRETSEWLQCGKPDRSPPIHKVRGRKLARRHRRAYAYAMKMLRAYP